MLFLLFVASRLVVAGVIQSCSLRNTCTCVQHILCRNRSFLDLRGYTGVNWYRLWADKKISGDLAHFVN